MRNCSLRKCLKRYLPSFKDGLLRIIILATLLNIVVVFSNYKANEAQECGHIHELNAIEGKSKTSEPILERVTNDPTALVTLWLFGATCVLAIVTTGLWWSTGSLVEGAEETAERQLRAYVFPVNVDLSLSTTTPKLTITYKNCGQTPAYDVTLWTTTAAAVYPLLEEPRGPEIEPNASRGHIGPGESIHCEAFPEPPITHDEIAHLLQGEGALYLYGVLHFTDAFKEKRAIKFCYFRGGQASTYRDGPMAIYNKWNEAD